MFSYFKYIKTPLMGLDISSSSIKVLELSQEGGEYVVDTYGVELLPAQSVVEKAIKEESMVISAIRRLIKNADAKRVLAAVAVSGSSVITKIIQVNAQLKEKEILDQIRSEADRYIPYPLEEVYLDHEILGVYSKNPEFVDVLLAAARIETVDERKKVVIKAGITPTVIDVEALAIEKAFSLVGKNLSKTDLEKNIALMDIGGTNTDIYIFQNGRAIYYRSQAFGGKQLTDEIQRRYSLTEEEAIVAQRTGDLPEDYLEEVLDPFKETVVMQITRAIQVYSSTSEENVVNMIMLAGGVAMIPGIDLLVQTRLSMKTMIANPFLEMKFSNRVNKNLVLEEGPSLMMVCGLALRNFDNE